MQRTKKIKYNHHLRVQIKPIKPTYFWTQDKGEDKPITLSNFSPMIDPWINIFPHAANNCSLNTLESSKTFASYLYENRIKAI